MKCEEKKRGVLFILSAPSGAGKTTLCREVMKVFPEIRLSISYTTRSKRSGETDGVDYFFINKEEFRHMIKKGAFAEWAKVHNQYYGTTMETIKNSVTHGVDQILDIDWQGAKQLKKNFNDGVYIFILPPSLKELESRIRKRGEDSEEAVKTRLDNAVEEMNHAGWYDYNITNDDLKKALSQLNAIIVAEKCRTSSQVKA